MKKLQIIPVLLTLLIAPPRVGAMDFFANLFNGSDEETEKPKTNAPSPKEENDGSGLLSLFFSEEKYTFTKWKDDFVNEVSAKMEELRPKELANPESKVLTGAEKQFKEDYFFLVPLFKDNYNILSDKKKLGGWLENEFKKSKLSHKNIKKFFIFLMTHPAIKDMEVETLFYFIAKDIRKAKDQRITFEGDYVKNLGFRKISEVAKTIWEEKAEDRQVVVNNKGRKTHEMHLFFQAFKNELSLKNISLKDITTRICEIDPKEVSAYQTKNGERFKRMKEAAEKFQQPDSPATGKNRLQTEPKKIEKIIRPNSKKKPKNIKKNRQDIIPSIQLSTKENGHGSKGPKKVIGLPPSAPSNKGGADKDERAQLDIVEEFQRDSSQGDKTNNRLLQENRGGDHTEKEDKRAQLYVKEDQGDSSEDDNTDNQLLQEKRDSSTDTDPRTENKISRPPVKRAPSSKKGLSGTTVFLWLFGMVGMVGVGALIKKFHDKSIATAAKGKESS